MKLSESFSEAVWKIKIFDRNTDSARPQMIKFIPDVYDMFATNHVILDDIYNK